MPQGLHMFGSGSTRHKVMAGSQVEPDPARCVQCGICSFYCPVGIDVRSHVWRGESIVHSQCLTCGECIKRCPRAVLQFAHTGLFSGGGP